MNTHTLRRADIASLGVIMLSLIGGSLALPALPGEVTVQWSVNGSPNTVLPALPAVLLLPTIALLAFAYLRGGVLLSGRRTEIGPRTGFAVFIGLAYLQGALIALNLGVSVNPVAAVAPAVLVILVATYAERAGFVQGA
ncbi:hypothetical protein [Haloarchaeobius amylolyticus]|uniref:hypothetical protein n=1 Tax=Haloarchaeobius amylolyticus TaxID=1198296 RepID=UPI00227098CA|nr:hypothetical protein [Haloarchaeobius amylolyticus]